MSVTFTAAGPWDAIDAVLLTAIHAGTLDTVDLPGDVVKNLTLGYLTAGYVTQQLPGCDSYQLTLTGRACLARLLTRLTAATAADTRKAA